MCKNMEEPWLTFQAGQPACESSILTLSLENGTIHFFFFLLFFLIIACFPLYLPLLCRLPEKPLFSSALVRIGVILQNALQIYLSRKLCFAFCLLQPLGISSSICAYKLPRFKLLCVAPLFFLRNVYVHPGGKDLTLTKQLLG